MTTGSGDASSLAAQRLRVTTFNVLHDSVRTFAPPWMARRPIVVETIRSLDPDVVCLQEVSARQCADLVLDLDEFDFVVGAASGATKLPRRLPIRRIAKWVLGDFFDLGEHCPILLRKGRATCSEHGSFWISPHPERPGSTLDGSATPHVVTWARVATPEGGLRCTLYNTHLGVAPWAASRTASALLAALDRDRDSEPQILTGDFNSSPRGVLVRSLLAARGDGSPCFHDAWHEAKRSVGNGRTFHWGVGLPGPRIDYILVRPNRPVWSATTVDAPGGVFPSDHSALTAELELIPNR